MPIFRPAGALLPNQVLRKEAEAALSVKITDSPAAIELIPTSATLAEPLELSSIVQPFRLTELLPHVGQLEPVGLVGRIAAAPGRDFGDADLRLRGARDEQQCGCGADESVRCVHV